MPRARHRQSDPPQPRLTHPALVAGTQIRRRRPRLRRLGRIDGQDDAATNHSRGGRQAAVRHRQLGGSPQTTCSRTSCCVWCGSVSPTPTPTRPDPDPEREHRISDPEDRLRSATSRPARTTRASSSRGAARPWPAQPTGPVQRLPASENVTSTLASMTGHKLAGRPAKSRMTRSLRRHAGASTVSAAVQTTGEFRRMSQAGAGRLRPQCSRHLAPRMLMAGASRPGVCGALAT